MDLLAGDIGGTKTVLALFRAGGGNSPARNSRLEQVAEATYSSPAYSGLEALVGDFLQRHPATAVHAALGIAGPVFFGRQTQTTNLPWSVDADALASTFGFTSVRLLNDLEALAHGLGVLDADQLLVLHEGRPASGNAALIAAGTGLGEAGLFWDGDRHRPFATEGGHTGFSPENEEERALLAFMAGRFERVSWERVLSGSALPMLLDFVVAREGQAPAEAVGEAMQRGDPAAAITAAALEGRCNVCTRVVELFVRLYGSEAGNLGLKFLAYGGVYLGGGIAPKLADKLSEPGFVEAFLRKGRLRPVLEAMPVKLILEPRTGLLGAARCAARSAEESLQSPR